jgi:uncharacterized protein (TIGR00730 family)
LAKEEHRVGDFTSPIHRFSIHLKPSHHRAAAIIIMKRICVFCGSSPGARPEYRTAAINLGEALVARGFGLVYGGANVGLMGVLAHSVQRAGGEVIGVIPQSMVKKELAFTGLSDLRITGSMHERKAVMADLADGFVAMPGGLGTLEEFFEVLTWTQLGIHQKPSGILNVEGYFDRLIAFLDYSVAERFVKEVHRSMLIVDRDPIQLLDRFASYVPPKV